MINKMPEKDRSAKGMFNPFPGLRPFTPEEADLFFGREGQSEEVMAKLKQNRFVTVTGASGSGKSSLVLSGLIPRLVDSEGSKISNWQVLHMKPGNDPLGSLAGVIAGNLPVKVKDGVDRTYIENTIRKDENGIINAINKLKLKKDIKSLLIIDQFEELFRFGPVTKLSPGRRDNRFFINLLVNAVRDESSGISVILTMRSDYIGECAHYQGLTELINNSNYLLPYMTEDDYRDVIVKPVEHAGSKIDNELVDLIIDDIGERTDQLPVLQHALMRTWDNWVSMGVPDKPLSVANYDAIGKMSGAMSRHADEAYEELQAREKEICEVLFRTITEKGPDNKGVRHPTRLKTIADIARCSEHELIRVIDTFRAPGRSFVTPAHGVELKGDTVIDISHESLMRVWERLKQWVDREAESERMYLRLADAAAMFQEGKTSLYRPPDLQLALAWRNDNKPTLTWAERFNPSFERAMVFLRTSEKEYIKEEERKTLAQKRRIRRSRAAAAVLGVAAILAVFLMLFAFIRQMETEKQKQAAEEQKQEATAQKMIAEDNAIIAERKAEQAMMSETIARENAEEALRQKEIANREALMAEDQRTEALATAASAKEKADKSVKLRMVSVSQSMAVRSLQFIGQGDLQVLLAYQAYLFNKRNSGIDNDADIYTGLYNVVKHYGTSHYRTFEGHEGIVNSISYADGSDNFYSAGSDGSVLNWNITDNTEGPEKIYEGADEIEIMAVSSDGSMLAFSTGNAVISVVPVSEEENKFELTGHTAKVNSIAFTPDNRSLVSAGSDGKVIKWDIASRESSVILSTDESVNSIDISRSGKYLIAASSIGSLYMWDLDNESRINSIQTEKGSIKVARFRDENRYAVGYEDGLIEIRSINGGGLIESVQAHSVMITDIQFNNELNQMASADLDGMVKIWNYNDLTQPSINLDDNNGSVYTLAFSPNGLTLISGTEGNSGNSNIIARSTHADFMAENMCSLITRNFTFEEWWRYVGRDIEYQETCNPRDLKIRIQQIKGD